MKKVMLSVVVGVVMMMGSSVVMAQTWGSALQAVGQTVVQKMSPQAQSTLEKAKKLEAGVAQEEFIVSKAKEFLMKKNYQPALDLASYVITTLNSKSVDAKKIMTDAKTALMQMAQEKLAKTPQQQQALATAQQGQAHVDTVKQIKTDAHQAATGIKNLFGTQK